MKKLTPKQKAELSLRQQNEAELKDAISKLLAKHSASDIFSALVNDSTAVDFDYLQEETITHLTDRGFTVVKIDGMNKQMQFEDSMKSIMPHSNERQANLFTPYLQAIA